MSVGFRRRVTFMHAKDNDDSLPTPGVYPEASPVPPDAPSKQPVYEPYSKNPAVVEPTYRPYDGI
jgi:hypothetical protein